MQERTWGGKFFKHSVVAVGAPAIEAISRIHADTYFMGVIGIHPKFGLTTGDFEEAHLKRALSESAAETIVLSSSEKLNAVSPYVIAPLSQVTGMIVAADTKSKVWLPSQSSESPSPRRRRLVRVKYLSG